MENTVIPDLGLQQKAQYPRHSFGIGRVWLVGIGLPIVVLIAAIVAFMGMVWLVPVPEAGFIFPAYFFIFLVLGYLSCANGAWFAAQHFIKLATVGWSLMLVLCVYSFVNSIYLWSGHWLGRGAEFWDIIMKVLLFPVIFALGIQLVLLLVLTVSHQAGRRYSLVMPKYGWWLVVVAVIVTVVIAGTPKFNYLVAQIHLATEPKITYTNPTGDFSIQIGTGWSTAEASDRVTFSRILPRSKVLGQDSLCDPEAYTPKLIIGIHIKPLSYCTQRVASGPGCVVGREVDDQDSIESYYRDAGNATFIKTFEVGGKTPLVVSDADYIAGPCHNDLVDAYVIAKDGRTFRMSYQSEEGSADDIISTLETFRLLK